MIITLKPSAYNHTTRLLLDELLRESRSIYNHTSRRVSDSTFRLIANIKSEYLFQMPDIDLPSGITRPTRRQSEPVWRFSIEQYFSRRATPNSPDILNYSSSSTTTIINCRRLLLVYCFKST